MPNKPDTKEALLAGVQGVLDAVEGSMSTYNEASELMLLNGTPPGRDVVISSALASVLSLAREVGRASDGLFDVSVGPLVEAWGFGARERRTTIPTAAEIKVLRGRVGPDKWRLTSGADGGAAVVSKVADDVWLDVSAVAKGFAVDRVAGYLKGAGFRILWSRSAARFLRRASVLAAGPGVWALSAPTPWDVRCSRLWA